VNFINVSEWFPPRAYIKFYLYLGGIIYSLEHINFVTKVFQDNLDIHTIVIDSFLKRQVAICGYAKTTKVLREMVFKIVN